MVKKPPPLSLVAPTPTINPPPRKLGEHGLKLWNQVMSEYRIDDVGGIELLANTCSVLDRAEALAARVAEDGAVIYPDNGPPRVHPAAKEELACRSFLTRTLQRLGLNVESIKPVGRPGKPHGWRGE